MSNVYLVKVVGSAQVVGLAVSSGGAWIGTSYAQSDKSGELAPTTPDAVRSAIASGAIPLPPESLLAVIGMPVDDLTASYADEGDVYYEHVMVA